MTTSSSSVASNIPKKPETGKVWSAGSGARRLRTAMTVAALLAMPMISSLCNTAVTMAPVQKPNPLINLNRVVLEPMEKKATGEPEVVVRKTREGQNYILLNLSFQGAGLHIVDAIRTGRILEHKIVVRDSRGRVIGSSPINFQAVKVTRTRIQKDEQDILVTDENTSVPLEDATEGRETVQRSYALRSFSEDDRIPQSIVLTSVPAPGEHISVYVEISLVDPVLQELCSSVEAGACPRTQKMVFREVENDNRDVIQEIIDRYKNYERGPFRFELKKTPDYYRKAIQEEIAELNKRNTHDRFTDFLTPGGNRFEEYSNVARTGSRVFYREWKLLGEPRYFKISLKEEVEDSLEEKKMEKERKEEQTLEGRDDLLKTPEGSYEDIKTPEGSYD